MKLTIYKGYTVTVDENSGQFRAEKESYRTTWFQELELLKVKIDKLIQAENTKGFPVEIFLIVFSNFEKKVIRGKLTSHNPEENSAWFVDIKGKREKIDFSYRASVYLANEVNDILLKELESKFALLTQTEKEIKTITGQLTKWQPTKETVNE